MRGPRDDDGRRLRAVGIALWALLAAPPAQAVDGVAWQWPEGSERRWLFRVQAELPAPIPVVAQGLPDAAVTSFSMGLVIRCRVAQALGRKAWALACDIDDAVISGGPAARSAGLVLPVLQAWEVLLEEVASLEIVQTRHGRVRSIDLGQLPQGTPREQQASVWLRQLVLRALAPLDVELPRKGDDKGKGAWVQSEAAAMRIPSPQGSVGGMRVEHGIMVERERLLSILLHGEASMAEAVEVGDQIRNYQSITLDGSYVFDRSVGAVVESQYVAEGTPSAGADGSTGRGQGRYMQVSVIQTLAADAPAPNLGACRETGPKD